MGQGDEAAVQVVQWAEAGATVRTEISAKYPNWNNLQNLGTTVQRVYDNP